LRERAKVKRFESEVVLVEERICFILVYFIIITIIIIIKQAKYGIKE